MNGLDDISARGGVIRGIVRQVCDDTQPSLFDAPLSLPWYGLLARSRMHQASVSVVRSHNGPSDRAECRYAPVRVLFLAHLDGSFVTILRRDNGFWWAVTMAGAIEYTVFG